MARVTAFLDDDKLFKVRATGSLMQGPPGWTWAQPGFVLLQAAELSDQMVVFLGSASEHKGVLF